MKTYDQFNWDKNKLYENGFHWATVVPEKDKPKMWRIWWVGNGEFSMDYFNKARAMDNAQKMACFLANRMAEADLQMSTGAFKPSTPHHPTTPPKITHPRPPTWSGHMLQIINKWPSAYGSKTYSLHFTWPPIRFLRLKRKFYELVLSKLL